MKRVLVILFGQWLVQIMPAQPITVTIRGTAGPWNQVSNPNYDYGVHDNIPAVVVDASRGISFTPGATITIRYSGGSVSASNGDPSYPFVDANGDLSHPAAPEGTNNGKFPSSFTSSPDSGYLAQLVGTFAKGTSANGTSANDGVIVGSPFIVGNGPITLTIPAGANRLQLGINDNYYTDNGGEFTVSIVSADCFHPTIGQVRAVNPYHGSSPNNPGRTKYDGYIFHVELLPSSCSNIGGIPGRDNIIEVLNPVRNQDPNACPGLTPQQGHGHVLSDDGTFHWYFEDTLAIKQGLTQTSCTATFSQQLLWLNTVNKSVVNLTPTPNTVTFTITITPTISSLTVTSFGVPSQPTYYIH